MKTIYFKIQSFFLLSICFFSIQKATAQAGDVLFNNSNVHTLSIVSNYPGDLIDSLNTRHQQEVSTDSDWSYMQVNAYFDGVFVDSIGMRLKGGDVSYSTTKPSIKLDLNEFVSGKKYDGLKKINIDNCLHDPSLMREKLYYDIAHELGYSASRTSFVKVTIDGVYYGDYVYIEQVNKQFLKQHFGNKDGNLFKIRGGGHLNLYGNNTQNDYPYSYDLKTNETQNDWSNLLHLIDKVANTPSSDFKDTISKYLNVESVLNYLALGSYTVYSDNVFSGGNNGYWYYNTATGKFELIPWDIDLSFMDQTLVGYQYTASNTQLINPIMNHGVFAKLLSIPEYQNSYLEKCCFINHHLGHEDSLKAKIDFYKSLLQNASIIPNPNCEYTSFSEPFNPYIMGYTFLGLKDFAEKRHLKVSQELNILNVTCQNLTPVEKITSLESISIYPNPASKSFFIETEQAIDKVMLYDTVGKLIEVINDPIQEINVEHLNPGIYLVLVEQAENIIPQKIVISH